MPLDEDTAAFRLPAAWAWIWVVVLMLKRPGGFGLCPIHGLKNSDLTLQ